MKMAHDEMLWLLFQLCDDKDRFVYEITPMFGKILTIEEMEYWIVYNIIQRAKVNEVEYQALPMTEVIRLCDEAESKKRAKYAKSTAK